MALIRDTRGASAAEFALVVPLLLLLLFAVIDGGRFMWEYNRAEKATQMGARFAVVTDMVPAGLASHSFSIDDAIPQGSVVPTADFDSITCDDTDCPPADCVGSVCASIDGTYDAAAFDNIVTRMSYMYPQILPANVTVTYKNVGLGYAGDPNGPDVAPLVTVRLRGLSFHPITCLVFACSIDMPDFRAALTLEDASGSQSN
jgi:hypothetical protein